MAFLVAAILVLAPFVVLILAGDPIDRPDRTTDPEPAAPLTADEQARCEVEGLLARRLVAGEVGRAVYHEAMAELAERDARSRPLRVPAEPPQRRGGEDR